MSLRRGAGPTILRALLALAVVLASIAMTSAALAHKHRKHAHHGKHHAKPRTLDPVVASGTSLFGVPWQVTVPGGNPGVIEFSVDSRDRYMQGWLARNYLPSSPPSVFTAKTETSIDPGPEGELIGVTSANVAMLEVHMSDGSIFEIYPVPAAAAAQNRLSWLSQIRVFDAFFPAGGVMPQVATALDAGNNVLAERVSSDGSF